MTQITKNDKIILVLSIYVIIELYIHSIVEYSQTYLYVTETVDFIICLYFIYDFFYRYYKTDNKLSFIRSNWIDLVSSIPTISILRIGRVVRIIRVLRIIRSGKYLYRVFNKKNSLSTFQNIVFLIILLNLLASVSIFQVEQELNPFFNSIQNSIWWCLITTTTLGFVQDFAPVTYTGKILSVLLISLGMVLFGSFTAMMADIYIEDEVLKKEIERLHDKIDKINDKLDKVINNNSDNQT